VWDLNNSKEVLLLKGHEEVLNFAAFLPGEERIVTGAQDSTVKIWDARTPCEAVTRFDDLGRFPSNIAPDGARVLCSEVDNSVSVCDAMTGERLVHLKEAHSASDYGGTFSADGSRVETMDVTNTVSLWDSRSGALVQVLRIPFDAKKGLYTFGKLSPNGARYVSKSTDNFVRMWDVVSGRQLYEVPTNSPDTLAGIDFDPQGERFVNCGKTSMDIWDVRSGERLAVFCWGTEKEDDKDSTVLGVSFNREGTKLITTHGSGLARVWDARTGEVLLTLRGHSRMLVSADFSPDGTRIVTAGDDKTLRIWDTTTGIELLTLRGHTDQVGQVIFTPDGTRIISKSSDRTVRIWDSRPFRETRVPREKK
jgi:WD40 repeat protein